MAEDRQDAAHSSSRSPRAVAAADHGAAPPVWQRLRFEARAAAEAEPSLSTYLNATVLNHNNLTEALCYHLAQKLDGPDMNALQILEICEQAHGQDEDLVYFAERDMQAVLERDPACRTLLQPFLFFKGFLAIQSHRIAHWLWTQERDTLSFFFQSRTSELFSVDVHPAAHIGSGLMLDHATGIVIGETARVGDDCSLLHGVTLGGTGKEYTDRHPKIGNGVLIGAGAKVLGNIHVGDLARIGSSSVVLADVPAQCSVAGVPAKPVGGPCHEAARNMDHRIDAE
ncbi:MAG: serine O-acetyltransferase [Pseudomonadota bacterium]